MQSLGARIEVIDELMAATLRQKTGAERLEIASRFDIVVGLPAAAVQEFCRQFPEEDFYVSQEAARDAVQRCSQFNIIQPASGLKIDVTVPPPSEFNRARFARARRVQAGEGWDASFSSPEDAILKKKEFFREGGSDKHLRDITGVLKTSRSETYGDLAGHSRQSGRAVEPGSFLTPSAPAFL